MKTYALMLVLITLCSKGLSQKTMDSLITQQELNKQLARNFFEDLWFSNNTSKYSDYVADNYIVHDIGDRKGVTEPAIEQKHIADFFWKNGAFDSKIDYQIAEGDLVATRWTGFFKANTLFGRIALETKKPISIINVFRIKNGKIVEFWNHRHDIDTPQTLKFTLKGLLFGLLIALAPTILAIRLKRKLKRISHGST
ncbi:MAG: ester cyclase [Flavobacteriaceae bacterium]